MSTPASPAGPLDGFVDDATALLPDAPGGLLEATARTRGPLERAVVVRDTDLPLLRGATVPLTVLVTGGAGQIPGPAELAARLGLRLERLHVVLRDPGDLAANARRVVAAVDDALGSGLDEDVDVHVEVPDAAAPGDSPSASWLAAVDELAAADLGLALPLVEPWGGPDGAPVAPARFVGWVDAALDRETPFSVLGATARPAGAAPGPLGALAALVATRLVLDGDPEAAAEALAGEAGEAGPALLARTTPAGLARARRWCTRAVAPDPGPVAEELAAALAAAGWAG